MLRQVISKFSTYPRTLVAPAKFIGNHGSVLSSTQCGISSTAPLCSSRLLHTGCLLKPNIISKYAATSLSGSLSPLVRSQPSLLRVAEPPSLVQTRTVIKWSLSKGKRKTVKSVLKRFKRLDWDGRGIWIRPRAGAKKRMWKKGRKRRYRCKTHVFCSATQSFMLDKMVTRFWRKRRHYPDDPYRPYLKREDFRLTNPYPREYF